MKLSSQLENEVIQRFFDLYITAQYKYIIMNSDGAYTTYNSYDNTNHQPIRKWHIRDHLNGKHTLGIFAANHYTSFICFDIDIKNKDHAKWTTYKLVDILIELGIPEEFIYTSTSGNKGYHVDIYFKDVLMNEVVRDLYNLVMDKIKLTDYNINGDIELRPTKQGLKLPLGINFKNIDKKSNTCWYVDYNNSLEPIKSYEYILNIKQIDTEIIKNILEKENDIEIFDYSADKVEAQTVEDTKGYLDSKYKRLESYENNIDYNSTIENAMILESEGLKFAGSRHNSLYSLCKYYKHLGMTSEENNAALNEWMNEQDTRHYRTPIHECYKDINKIVEYIYENDINIVKQIEEIKITYNDMLDILKANSKNEKLLMYSMIIHSKRYANEKGIFYMSYKQMVNSTGLSERTVKRLVNKLMGNKSIDIVERNRKVLDNKGNLLTKRPNVYKVLLTDDVEDDPMKYITISNNTEINFNNALLMFFDKSELKKVLPDRHYRELNVINN